MDTSYTEEINYKIEQSNFKRLSLLLKITLGVHIFLLLSVDVFNYLNAVWVEFPSQYFAFINRAVTVPFLLLALYANRAYLAGKSFLSNSSWLLLINLLVLTPMIMVYYVWDVIDYGTSGVFIIYICAIGFVIQFTKTRRILSSIYFLICYFGVLLYLRVSYFENPSIYLLGIAVLVLYWVLSKHLYNERALSAYREIALQESVKQLGLSNKQLNAELKGKLLMLNNNISMHQKFREIIKNRNSNPNIFSDLNKLISSNTNESIISELEEQFLGVHETFVQELSKRFPHLTANNLKLCILIKLGLCTKEIAQIRYVTPASVKVAKSRLRKSLGTEMDLFTFLNALVPEEKTL